MTTNNCNPNNSDCFSGDAAQGLTKLGGVVLLAASAVRDDQVPASPRG